jgi:hypothetical protein
MRELRELMDRLVAQLRQVVEQEKVSFEDAVVVENKVISAKETATEVYGKTYDLENYLVSRDIEFSVEDAVRHVLTLLYTSVAVVDSDEHVKAFKGQILGEVSAKYGVEKTEELKQGRKYLEIEI